MSIASQAISTFLFIHRCVINIVNNSIDSLYRLPVCSVGKIILIFEPQFD